MSNKVQYNVDPFSPTFKFVKTFFEDSLQRDREKIEGDASEVQTAKLRGRLQLARDFLKELEKYEAK